MAPAPAPGSALRAVPELSVIVPTFNERANIPILVERLSRVLAGSEWEVLFVDDNSPDGTAAAARTLG
ncbi:MAG: glycosyltransferase, partial [Xanthobacteraceae bacterium]